MKRKYKSSRIKSYVMLAFLALMLGMMLGTINDLTPIPVPRKPYRKILLIQ